MESLTDNRNRTSAEVRHLFSKHGGHLGEPNSVSYMFEKKGMIVFDEETADEDRVLEIALENGAEDVRSEDGAYEVVCAPERFDGVRDAFAVAEIAPQLAEVSLHPTTTVELDRDHALKVLKLVSALEDNDDVQRVSSNFDIPGELLAELEEEI